MRIRYIFIILIYSVVEIAAQGGGSVGVTDSRATAMGKSYTVSSRGIYSISRNPANLAIPQDHNVEISTLLPLPNISMGLGNDFLTLNDYNFFFTGDGSVEQGNQARYLSDSDKQRFKQLFDQGNSIHTGIAFSLFGISINAGREVGSFAFSINDRMAAKGGLPTDYIDLLLYGNEAGRVYDLKDATFQSSYTRDYSLSYAREITPSFLKRLSIGASIKMVHGFWYGGIENFGSSVETIEQQRFKNCE